MKSLIVSALVGAAIGVAVIRPDLTAPLLGPRGVAANLYAAFFPGGSARRTALELCFRQDPEFDRLDRAARAACYRHFLPAQSDGATIAPHPANFVDLWRAAGRGSQPRDDIAIEQQSARITRPQAARLPQ